MFFFLLLFLDMNNVISFHVHWIWYVVAALVSVPTKVYVKSE